MILAVHIQPNNWAGLWVSLATCAGSFFWVMLLFAWDDPEQTKQNRDTDILRGLFDDRRLGTRGTDRD